MKNVADDGVEPKPAKIEASGLGVGSGVGQNSLSWSHRSR